jgi:hypothetical protein
MVFVTFLESPYAKCEVAIKGKGKGRVHARTGHRASVPLFLTSALVGGGVVNAAPRPLCPQERDPVPIEQAARCASRPF